MRGVAPGATVGGLTGSLGPSLVVVALAAAVAAVAAAATGRTVTARRLLVAVLAGSGAALGLLAWALLTGDFSLAYVADQSVRAAPWAYRLAALWGGMEGSLLLWVGLLAGHALVADRLTRRAAPHLLAPTQAALAATVCVFLLPLATVARPFARLAVPALDGGGLAPVLENPAMLYHPPLLYLGYTGLVVPFAVTVAALVTTALDHRWVALCRRTTLLAWVPLTAGVATGAHWAYAELGWGGFWAWDPVENAALMPWLAATAFLHGALVRPARRAGRGDSRVDGGEGVRLAGAGAGRGDVPPVPGARRLAALVVATFALSVLGAWLTRSGATVSVHAFAEARAVGRIVLAGLALTVTGGALLIARAPAGGGPAARRRWSWRVADLALATAPVALLGACGVVLFGTVVPLLSGLVLDRPMVAAPRFFTTFVTPFAVVVAVALAAWARGAATGAPRRAGTAAVVAHAGAALVLLALAGSAFGSARSAVLAVGESADIGPYTVRLERLTETESPRRRELGAVVAVERGGRTLARLQPELHAYPTQAQPQSETSLRSTPLADLLVTPRRIDLGAQVVVLDLFVKPLVAWLWVGAALMAAGGALALVTARRGAGERSPAGAAGEPAQAQAVP